MRGRRPGTLRRRGGATAPGNGRVSDARRTRSSGTASPDPGSLVVRPHRARFGGGAGKGRAGRHAIQSNRRRRAVASRQATPLRAPAFGAREAASGAGRHDLVRGEGRSSRVITEDCGRARGRKVT